MKIFLWTKEEDKRYVFLGCFIDLYADGILAGVVLRTMKQDARKVADWDFDRYIPCHGVRPAVLSFIIFPSLPWFLVECYRDRCQKGLEGSMVSLSLIHPSLSPMLSSSLLQSTISQP